MIQTTYNSETLYLFPYPANWEGRRPVRIEARMPSKFATGKSARQQRAPLGESLRIGKYAFKTLLDQRQAVQLKEALLVHTEERIVAPFWPLARPASEFAALPIKGSVNVTFETLADGLGYPDFDNAFEIHTGDTPVGSFSALAWTAPLLFLDWENRPDPLLITDELASLKVSFVEDSEVSEALLVGAVSFPNGPALADATVYKIFPLEHNFDSPAKSGGAELLIESSKVGNGRRLYKEYHGAPANRPLGMQAWFDTIEDAAKLLRFFQDHRGMVTPFWAPAYLAETRIAQNVGAAATIVNVEDASSLATHGWIAILTPDGPHYRKIVAINGNQVTLDAALGVALSKENTSLCALLLTRFDRRVISIAFGSDVSGEASIDCIEVSPEYVPPANETRGSTLGPLPLEASLYEFSYEGLIWRYACYEENVTWGVNSFPKIHIEHSDIEEDLLLQDNCTITAKEDECEPLSLIARRKIPYLDVVIYKGEVSGGVASNVQAFFHGEVVQPMQAHPLVRAKCGFLGYDMEIEIPRQRHQRPCPHNLFCPDSCKLLKSDWTFSAVFVDVGTAGFPYTFTIGTITRDNAQALPTFFANWFAWGKVWVDTGEGLKSCRIASSTAIAGGQITLTLERDFAPFPAVNDTLKLRPACDGQMKTCDAYHATNNPTGKFGNLNNFGGVKVAKTNHTMIKPAAPTSPSKK